MQSVTSTFESVRSARELEPVARARHPLCVEPILAVADAELVRDARAGHAAALAVLLERHRAPLYAVALSILGDRGLAQDAVQDAFLVALRRLDDLRDPASAGPWLRTIVRNAALMQRRRNREVPAELSDVPTDEGLASVETTIERSALRDWVWTTLEQLPEDQRATVMLRFFSRQSSYERIAAILGIPIGTVRSRLNSAKQRLADALLQTAASTYDDHTEMVQQRWRTHLAAVDEMTSSGNAAGYFADFTPDVLIVNTALGYRGRGVAGERHTIEQGLALGVYMQLTGIVASREVTILEADYHNPIEHPTHCPPLHTEIRVHPRGPTTRLILHFGRS